MLQGIKDYTKCASRNEFVLWSYLGLGASLSLNYLENKTGISFYPISDLMMFVSIPVLGVTKLGLETTKAYRRMKEHISKHGTVEPRFKDKFSSMYCTQVGIKIAIKEAGLEKLLK